MGFDTQERPDLPLLPLQEDLLYHKCVWCAFALDAYDDRGLLYVDLLLKYPYGERACPKCHRYIPVKYMRKRPQ